MTRIQLYEYNHKGVRTGHETVNSVSDLQVKLSGEKGYGFPVQHLKVFVEAAKKDEFGIRKPWQEDLNRWNAVYSDSEDSKADQPSVAARPPGLKGMTLHRKAIIAELEKLATLIKRTKENAGLEIGLAPSISGGNEEEIEFKDTWRPTDDKTRLKPLPADKTTLIDWVIERFQDVITQPANQKAVIDSDEIDKTQVKDDLAGLLGWWFTLYCNEDGERKNLLQVPVGIRLADKRTVPTASINEISKGSACLEAYYRYSPSVEVRTVADKEEQGSISTWLNHSMSQQNKRRHFGTFDVADSDSVGKCHPRKPYQNGAIWFWRKENHAAVSIYDGAPVVQDAVDWKTAKASWKDASDAIDSQIGKLQSVLKTSGDDELVKIAEFGLNTMTGNFKVPLMAAILEIDGSSSATRGKVAGKTLKLIKGFRRHIKSSKQIAVVDRNPFGVELSIRRTLLEAFTVMEHALKPMTGNYTPKSKS